MQNKIKKLTLLLVILAGGLAARDAAAQSKVGTSSAAFLGISIGPRAVAMGGAFTAMTGDASALYYNPGSIVRMEKSQFVFSHTNWIVDTNLNWIGMVLMLNSSNAIGLSITQLDYGEEEVTNVYQPEGTGEMWTAGDLAISLSYSRMLTDRFSIGGSVKYIQQRLWNESASAFAIDVGLLFITDFNGMRIGMSISNFGNDMRMEGKDLLKRIDIDPEHLGDNETIVGNLKTNSWPLPLFFRVGVSMDVIKVGRSKLTLAADAFRPSNNSGSVNLGGEFSFSNMFFVRGGYKSLFLEGAEEGLTAGIGVNVPMSSGYTWCVDYTYMDFGVFDNVKMISASVKF